ncbi:MAG: four helix bundle protein [Candidatus Dojkabacteria bacterium]
MFAFENFPVYLKSEDIYKQLKDSFKNKEINSNLRDQLFRSATSIILNIAEGAGKMSKKDKRNFYNIARGSTQETVAIMRLLKLENHISEETYENVYNDLTTISKMLSGLMRSMESVV